MEGSDRTEAESHRAGEEAPGEGMLRRAPAVCEEIVECLPDPLVVIDRQYVVRAANAAYVRFWNLTPSQVIGHTVTEIVGREAFERTIRRQIDRALAGEGATIEEWFRFPAAGRRYIELRHYPLRIEGRIELVAVLIRDLTARKQAEATLEPYRALFQHARDIILFVDAQDGRILEANEAALHAYGYSREALLSFTIYDLRAPETVPLVPAQLAEAAATGMLFETSHRRRDGSTFAVEVSSQPAPWNGRPALLSIIRDITARKQAEEAMARHERQFRQVLDSLPDIITRFDRDLRYTFVSPNVERISGSPPGAYIGKTPRETGLFDEATLRASEVYSQRALETGEVQTFEHPVITPQATFYYSVRIIPERDAQGHVVSLLNVSQDVTERRRAEMEREQVLDSLRDANERLVVAGTREQQLAAEAGRRAAEAEAALRVRDQFLDVAAHELKTPLTTLRGQAELTLRRIEQGRLQDPEQLRGALQTIDRQVGRLAGLVAQLLDISRIQAGELTLERHETDLVPLLRRLVETMQAEAPRHTLSLRAPASLVAFIDPLRVEQVLYSLLSNAIRYSPRGGPVEVELSAPDDGTARIAVRDYGIGVPPAERSRLFTRFFQASRRPVGGLGLGLYISRRIVEQHGGRIWAEFPKDGGSRFIISLPRRKAKTGA